MSGLNNIDFGSENTKALSDFLGKLGGNVEFEIRFGSFMKSRQQESNRRNFVTGKDIPFFYRLKTTFDKNFEKKVTKTQEYIFENSSGKGNIKKVIDNVTKKEHYVIKSNLSRNYDIYDFDVRMSLAKEQYIKKENLRDFDESNYKLIREKERISYLLPFGTLDLTIVNETNKTNSEQQTLPKYEIELEVNRNDIQQVMQFLTIILQTRQENFYVMPNREKYNVLHQYKETMKTPYFVGAQPETLQKSNMSILYKENYSVTDKADGERMLLFITGRHERNVYFIDNNMNRIYKTDLKSTSYYDTLLDGELLVIDNKITFLGFDMMCYNGKDIRGNNEYNLRSRLNRMQDIIDTFNSSDLYTVRSKKFYFKNVFLGSEKILSTLDQFPYKNDGLIFTPVNEPYPQNKKWPHLLKWKPADLNTIDFYAVKEGDNSWKLYVQQTQQTQQTQVIKSYNSEKVLFDVEKLCPQPTLTTSITSRTEFGDEFIDPTTGEPYKSNTVIEFSWDTKKSKFIPIRTRWDKTANPKKHGNFSTVACDIWNNIHNPVEKEMLFKFTTFTNSKGDFFFERMRLFHNKVKEYLYNKYTHNCEYLLELCSGRGGDMHKWMFNNIRHVVGYDISEKNIKECMRRLTTTPKDKLNGMLYNFHQIDLCSEKANQIIQLHMQKEGNNRFDNICCNFGLHYMFKSETSFNGLMEIISNTLKEGGYFIATFMDNTKIDNLFKSEQTIACAEHDDEIVYLLKRTNGNKQQFFNNNIRVILNGSSILSEGSDEYIINFEQFVKVMEENNFKLVETDTFDNIQFTNEFPLLTYEKDISYLNRYTVFQKCQKDEIVDIITPKQSVKSYPQHRLESCFDFNTIDLHNMNLSVFKLSTTHDVVNLVNCIDYKYNRNHIENVQLNTFDDIKSVFETIIYDFQPVYITNPVDANLYIGATTKQQLYFTYHKNVIEKKSDSNDTNTIEYDNWYIILYNDKMLFNVEDISPNVKGVIESNENKPSDRKKQVLAMIDSEKVTVKILKELLIEFGLKLTGKKEELYNRLTTYCTESL